MTDWSANIAKLQEIATTDPVFWQYLTKLAQTITACNYKYINEHRLPFCAEYANPQEQLEYESKALCDIKYLTICQKYKPDGTRKISNHISHYDTPCPPVAWVFPGPYEHATVICKNPIYIDNDRIYLTMTATGCNLNRVQQDKLSLGETVVQKMTEYCYTHEENFSLPVDVFTKTILDASIKN